MAAGHLGQDPELRYTAAQQPVATMSLAVNERWMDKSGKPQSRVDWIKVVAWGKLGELCAKNLNKGDPVFVEGKLRTRETDERVYVEVQAEKVEFLKGK